MPLATPSNYRTGISIGFSGTNGADWMIEPLYHDPLVEDRMVVYLRSATQVNFSNNARNINWAGRESPQPYAGSADVIRYRVDGDLYWGPKWAGTSGTLFPAYTAPITFDSLTYPAAQGSLSVLGRLGNNGGNLKTKNSRFWYGLPTAAGNEVHAICVAHDDRLTGGSADPEYWASDGRMFLFVVNPVTPVLQVRALTGGQFYTTPLKTYFLPKIHAQTTYFSGSCEFELKALTGEDVTYRINGGSWATATNPILTDAAFTTGNNTLEYYYGGNTAHIASRTVVKNPTHPSLAETHGLLRIGSEDNWSKAMARIGRAPYAVAWARLLNNRGSRVEWDAIRRQGLRIRDGRAITANMIAAKQFGNDAIPATNGTARTYAAYAKDMALENFTLTDCVGFEELASGGLAHPTREWIYRGYYDVPMFIDLAFGYDLLVALYRSDQHAGGVTPIEDYFLRDCLASAIVTILGMSTDIYAGRYLIPPGQIAEGMWSTCWKCGAIVAMFALPTYSTSYYGTCGLDGQTAVYPYTPWGTTPLTWKKAYMDDDAELLMFPDTAGPLGTDQLMRDTGVFQDKVSYMSPCGPQIFAAMWVCKFFYPSKTFVGPEACFRAAANGTLLGTKAGGYGPSRWVFLGIINSNWPEVANAAIELVRNEPSNSVWSDDALTNGNELAALMGYDDTYVGTPVVTTPPVFSIGPASATRTAGEPVTFTVSVTGTAPITLQWRKNGVNISGQTGTSYTIASTTLGDAGSYDCVATNSVSPTQSAPATLTVTALPPPVPTYTKRTNLRAAIAAIISQ